MRLSQGLISLPALTEDVLRRRSRVGNSSYFCFCRHVECKHFFQMRKTVERMFFSPCYYDDFPAALQLPSLRSWLWEQDAESITPVSANQSTEAHYELRRTAATQHNNAKTIISLQRASSLSKMSSFAAFRVHDVLDWEQYEQKIIQLLRQHFLIL